MNKFPYGKTLVIGFGFLGISVVWPVFNQFIPIFLQAGNASFEGATDIVGFGLSPALALFIMTWDNIINVFLQPWVGERSDRTWNRFGRRKGWLLLGTPIALLGFVSIPFAASAFAIAMFILVTNVGMALFRSPTVAWLGDLFPSEQRSQANGIINLMGGVGGLLAFFVGGMLFKSVGRAAPFVFGALMLLIAVIVVVLYVKEPTKIEGSDLDPKLSGVINNLKEVFANPNKSGLFVLGGILLWFMGFNALEAGLSSFAVFTLGIDAGSASIYAGSITIAIILFAIPAGYIGARVGRKKAIQIGLLGLVVMTGAGFLLIKGTVTFVIVLVFSGLSWAMINVNSLPLVYDYGDEKRIGAYTGLYYFSSQTAAVLGPTLSGVLVEAMGNEYRWLWLFSMVFMLLAWLIMFRVGKSPQLVAQPA